MVLFPSGIYSEEKKDIIGFKDVFEVIKVKFYLQVVTISYIINCTNNEIATLNTYYYYNSYLL